MQQYGVVVMAFAAALALQGQGVVIINGNSKLQGSKLKTSTITSIIGKDKAEGLEGGRALLEPESGAPFEVPCEVQIMPGENSQAEQAVWRVAVPAGTALKSMKIMRYDRIVATLSATKEAPPALECIESRSDEGVTIAWILKRAKRFEQSSIWVRWSKDGGTTWGPEGKFLPGDAVTGEVEFLTAELGDTSGMLVEFWIPQDLKVTVVRHKLSPDPKKQGQNP